MNKEDKELLVKDLSARLPFGVICFCGHDAQLKLVCPDGDYCVIQNSPYAIETVKPYLRPMSSMTEEEKKEFNFLINGVEERCINAYGKGGYTLAFTKVNDWLNKRHFDYRGLIEKGLALVAPEGMYKTK